ncbi:MAG: LUD domain-containing protein [Patescibacteria group bacterium]|jgi:hypothetical protein
MEQNINEKFGRLADETAVSAAALGLEKNGFKVIITADRESAIDEFKKLIPEGSEIMNMTSTTLAELGLDKEILESGRYRAVRKELEKLGEGEKIQKLRLGAAQEFAVGSVHAITEAGEVIIASATGSQLPAYAYGADKVIFMAGTQKIVKDFEEGMQRIREYVFPRENERALKAYGMGSGINKVMVLNKEVNPGRITMILIKEKLGF